MPKPAKKISHPPFKSLWPDPRYKKLFIKWDRQIFWKNRYSISIEPKDERDCPRPEASFSRARGSALDQPCSHQIQFERADCFRGNDFAVRALKMKGVKGTLHNAGAALNTVIGPVDIRFFPILIHLETVFWTHLFAEPGSAAQVLVKRDFEQTVFVQPAFKQRCASHQVY